jgi:hypothetical protein
MDIPKRNLKSSTGNNLSGGVAAIMMGSVAKSLKRMFRPHKSQSFNTIADPEDIHYCFRLLLGRNPSEDEWKGHLAAKVGKPLRSVVSSYLCSPEFANLNLLQGPTSKFNPGHHRGSLSLGVRRRSRCWQGDLRWLI